MISLKIDVNTFKKETRNLTEYAFGFFDGVQRGRDELLKEIGEKTKEILYSYIDSTARINPSQLHHVYEWYQTGGPESRLFDIQYRTGAGSLSMNATFTQSRSLQNGSTTPFYNKAEVMEKGISVIVRPREKQALRFTDGVEENFVRGPVRIENPGGASVAGGFDKVFTEFFEKYFTQSFMEASGLAERVRNLNGFVRNFDNAKTGGRRLGNEIGYRWAAGKEGT